MDRDWLARRIETEAWAYANADHLTRDLCLGRVLGFLEVGAHAGYWSKRAAEVADSIQQKWGLRKVTAAGAVGEYGEEEGVDEDAHNDTEDR